MSFVNGDRDDAKAEDATKRLLHMDRSKEKACRNLEAKQQNMTPNNAWHSWFSVAKSLRQARNSMIIQRFRISPPVEQVPYAKVI